ncbi:hypothetical protein RHSIM_Rhsim02G0145700 [Rhododendron simsii]|uniref:Uncharacterized protein n=1 Tax=Rhododendron simsii TaxID=118357 RepID=A0A834LX46_RHOSS|nr:hypothetical protein RHSIM_Rhsim02G0145700 [Rhododendron simsii]
MESSTEIYDDHDCEGYKNLDGVGEGENDHVAGFNAGGDELGGGLVNQFLKASVCEDDELSSPVDQQHRRAQLAEPPPSQPWRIQSTRHQVEASDAEIEEVNSSTEESSRAVTSQSFYDTNLGDVVRSLVLNLFPGVMNLITTIIGFGMSASFIEFVCIRLFCGRLRGVEAWQMIEIDSGIDLK